MFYSGRENAQLPRMPSCDCPTVCLHDKPVISDPRSWYVQLHAEIRWPVSVKNKCTTSKLVTNGEPIRSTFYVVSQSQSQTTSNRMHIYRLPFFCRHCRGVSSYVRHGSTISSADFLRKLNHTHKLANIIDRLTPALARELHIWNYHTKISYRLADLHPSPTIWDRDRDEVLVELRSLLEPTVRWFACRRNKRQHAASILTPLLDVSLSWHNGCKWLRYPSLPSLPGYNNNNNQDHRPVDQDCNVLCPEWTARQWFGGHIIDCDLTLNVHTCKINHSWYLNIKLRPTLHSTWKTIANQPFGWEDHA